MSSDASQRYSIALRILHWLGAALVLLAYLTSESAEEAEEGLQMGIDWHVVAGLGLLILFIPHLLARVLARHVPIQPAPGALAVWSARWMHVALLLFLVVQPVLGVLTVWAEGKALPVPFTSWQLPPVLMLGERWEDALEEWHKTVGNVFYAVIALHILAALWHHFIRRDNTLRRML